MKPENIRKFLEGHLHAIIELCDDTGKQFDKDTIHELRVEVKKLRAFMRFLNWCSRNNEARLPGRLRKLYHTAGYIREAQLELDMIADEDLPPPYYTMHLQTVITAQKHTWNSLYSGKPLDKIVGHFGKGNFEPVASDMLPEYMTYQLSRIGLLAGEGGITDDQLHDIRKHLKDILHLCRFAQSEWSRAHARVDATLPKSADKLGKLIGYYNDARLFYTHLGDFGVHTPDELEQKAITRLVAEKYKQLALQKASIMEEVKTFVRTYELIKPLAD